MSLPIPPTLPNSVDVRIMLEMPGAEKSRSLWRPPEGPLGTFLEPADILDARLVRPLVLGSLSARGMAVDVVPLLCCRIPVVV